MTLNEALNDCKKLHTRVQSQIESWNLKLKLNYFQYLYPVIRH